MPNELPDGENNFLTTKVDSCFRVSIWAGKLVTRPIAVRGHVKKKSKKTLEVGGWVKCPIGKKNWKTYFYTLFD